MKHKMSNYYIDDCNKNNEEININIVKIIDNIENILNEITAYKIQEIENYFDKIKKSKEGKI